MHFNEGFMPGIIALMPQGTNSTMFTECCNTAICDDERLKNRAERAEAELAKERQLRVEWIARYDRLKHAVETVANPVEKRKIFNRCYKLFREQTDV